MLQNSSLAFLADSVAGNLRSYGFGRVSWARGMVAELAAMSRSIAQGQATKPR